MDRSQFRDAGINAFDEPAVLAILRRAWSKESAKQWRPEAPAAGQCNVTALLLNELFGGVILKTPLADGLHFYNMIVGKRADLTASQFDLPIDYADLPSSRKEAEEGITRSEYCALKDAYLRHCEQGNDPPTP